MKLTTNLFKSAFAGLMLLSSTGISLAQIGVGAEPIKGAKVYLDGTTESLHKNWEYWEGPRFSAEMPIKWPAATDPNTGDPVISSNDPAGAGGKYGAADIVTKDKFRDFRAHVEFMVTEEGGNSGVYLQNRYEIQILDGDYGEHGMAAIINEHLPTEKAYKGVGEWNAYDIMFRAARFKDGKLVEKARATVYFNGVKIHEDKEINQVWGGPFSGLDGGNDGGKGITDTPGGLKLQAEGYNVLYKNVWIKEMKLKAPDTDF
ncbi:3-keto-disaccharide hydrolase [Algoriphagus namhaensis]